MKDFILIGVLFLTSYLAIAQEVKYKPRYTNHTEAGGLFGRVKYDNFGSDVSESKQSLTIQTFNGIQLNPRLSAGLTLGMDWYKAALINPISAGMRYDLTKGKSARLFTTLDAGYGFAWFHQDNDGYKTKGGLMLNPGIGMRYGKLGGTNFTMVLSYKRQVADVDEPLLWNQVERSESRVYNRLGIRIGMSF